MPNTSQRPSIGRIVHYSTRPTNTVSEGVHWAAIITAVYPAENGSGEVCALQVFPPGIDGYPIGEAVRQGEPGEPGTWHFPEIV